jgi:hypothetical protein
MTKEVSEYIDNLKNSLNLGGDIWRENVSIIVYHF